MNSRLLTAGSPLRPPPARRPGKISLSRLVSFSRRPNTAQVPPSPRSSRAASASGLGGATWPAPPGSSSSRFFLLLSDRVRGLALARGLVLASGSWASGWPMTRRPAAAFVFVAESAGTEDRGGGGGGRHLR